MEGVRIERDYAEVFSGFAVKAPADKLIRIAELPGVSRITEVGFQHFHKKAGLAES